MDYKQLKIMALALSLPGAILVAAYVYKYVIEKNLLAPNIAIGFFAVLLLSYILIIIRLLFKKKNE